jgi:PII-like signaling protein
MLEDGLKLTTYCGERDRAGGRFLADALIDVYARHALRTSVLLRGAEGFGARHGLHTDRLLTLSEDLPVVAVGVDARERIERVLPEVRAICSQGLITLERARLPTGGSGEVALPEATKLTIYLGRQERAAGAPAYLAVVAALQRHGVAGATALLGVDGTVRGARRRARFAGRNAEVPVMVIAVGAGDRVAAALPELRTLLHRPQMTLERVVVCRRDGQALAAPQPPPAGAGAAGLGAWQKLMVYASEQATHDGMPLYAALIRRLRAEGAAGATALRGFWGYHGDHAPHGDRFWALRRHVPVVTVIFDRPAAIARWFAIVEELTARTGLVTSEIVPAVHA